jgi:hypothetical protein
VPQDMHFHVRNLGWPKLADGSGGSAFVPGPDRGLRLSFWRHMQARTGAQEWTDAQILTALMVLHLAGGDCVDGLRTLEADEGFCLLLPPVPLPRTNKRPRGPGRGGGGALWRTSGTRRGDGGLFARSATRPTV